MHNKLILILVFCVSFGKTIGQNQSFFPSQIESLGKKVANDASNYGFYNVLKLMGPEITSTLINTLNGRGGMIESALNSLSSSMFLDVSQNCRQNMLDLVRSLFLGPEGWGWQIIDATGKVPTGLMKISLLWTGDYYQCINMKVNHTQITTNGPISGRYCYTKLMTPMSKEAMDKLIALKLVFGFGFGTCFPTSCSPKDVQLIFDYTTGNKLKIIVDEDFCSTTEGHKMDNVAIMLTIIVSIPIFLVILTTLFEYCQRNSQTLPTSTKKIVAVSSNQGGMWQSLCYIFSGRSSYASLVPSPTLISGASAVTCIYGIRISLMLLAIWIHVYTLRFLEFPWRNLSDFVPMLDNPRLHYCAQSFPIMQVFFLMSGFCLVLASYGSAKYNIESFSIIKSYIFRYIRMMPLYLYTAAFTAGPFFYLFKGPMWGSAKTLQIACRNNWLRRFLNFENYFHLYSHGNDCVTGEYFFGADWQLYLVAVPVVWLLLRKPRRALAIIITVMISITVLLALMAVFIENFHLIFYVPKKDEQHPSPGRSDHPMVLQVYTGFWSRLPGFGMGMLAGYFLARHGNKANISKRKYTYGWILFWVSNIMFELYGQFFFQAKYVPTFWVVTYSFFSNLMFPATWCFLIIYCVQFPSSFANKFLSLGIFQILGKLTFPMYVVQVSVLFWYYSSASEPGYLDYYTKVYDFVIITVVCIILSFILYFVIESPLDRFLKLIKGKSPRTVKKSSD